MSPRIAALARLSLSAALGLALSVAAPTASGTASGSASSNPTGTATGTASGNASARVMAAAAPDLRVRTLIRGLATPWDVQPIGRGGLLVTERDKARLSVVRKGQRRTVRFPSSRVWVSGETGLMSMAIDPAFERTRRFWTCQGWQSGSGHDVRVSMWRLSTDERRAKLLRHVVTGLPTTSGRHGGCRVLLDSRSTALLVGTGDAADPANPRDLTSLGGKVLRVDRRTGRAMPDNPFADEADPRQRLVLTYGHRNVQGLAQRPSDGAIVSVEHGSSRDDEVNALAPGADFGWNPGPGYDESVPMTDQSLPGQQTEAIWSSGDPTIATSGAAWTAGAGWGAYADSLAVAALAGERLLFIRFDADLAQLDVAVPDELRSYGRLRSVTAHPSGDLLITTSNGGNDRILRVSPR